jgi:hypothetical protein
MGMQAQMLGQLFGVRRPSQLAEQREQPRPGWLRKNIPWSGRYIHALQFCKARLGKPGLNVFCGGRAELWFPNEHLADRGGGDPALRRIGDNAAFNLHTIGLILMIVGASVSCPSSSGIRGGGFGGRGGYRRQRRVTRDGAGGYVEESAATC